MSPHCRFLLLLIPLVPAGCGDPYGGRLAVAGTVTLKGEPLADGVIFFVPLDGQGTHAADILATAGDLTKAMAEGKAFIDMSRRSIDEAVGSAVTRGGRVTFALLNSSFGHENRDIDSAADLVAMAKQDLKPHAAAIRAVDKKVKSLLAAQ